MKTEITKSTREGFTIVEVLIAMILLSIGLTTLAGLTVTTAKQAINLVNSSGRQAVTLQEVNRFASLPQDSIANHIGCMTLIAPSSNLTYTRCVTVTNSATYRTVRVIVTPSKAGAFADTVQFRRAIQTTVNPLYTP